MVYTTFLETVCSMLREQLNPEHKLHIQSIRKNNGRILDGLIVQSKDSCIAPTIYLNSYYEHYQSNNLSLDQIISDILSLLSTNHIPSHFTPESFSTFSHIKHKVMYKLIHTKSNTELLCDVPHIPFLDLSIVFYVFISDDTTGQMTALIRNNHLNLWDINIEKLYELACENTPKTLLPSIENMESVMLNLAQEHLDDFDREEWLNILSAENDSSLDLYVLTNSSGIFGASCILYPNILKTFSESLQCDMVILPSSIHEVLLVPNSSELSFSSLREMVISINESEVAVEDRLSDEIYLFTRKNNQVHLISPCEDFQITSS